jgi:DNA-binding response OmpR family regulator
LKIVGEKRENKGMSAHPRILVVDDAPDIQLIARKALERSFEVIAASNLTEADQRLAEGGIDLIVLDVNLPDGNGFDFCRRVSAAGRHKSPPIILLTSKSEIDDKLEGFSAGAEDYVIKPFDPSELKARALLRLRHRPEASANGGSGKPAAGDLHFGDIEFNPKGDSVTVHSSGGKTPISLTHREFRLLLCLARAGGKILSRNQIISTVWDSESRITGRTVDTHICKLRKKISPSRFTIHSVYGAGYRFVEPAEGMPATEN